MNLATSPSFMPAVPAQHAQIIASNVLTTWPMTIGLTVEYLAHHNQGPSGAVTFAAVRATEPWPQPILIRCDGYGRLTRGCDHPRPDGQPCWLPAASHLSLRDPGLCPRHLPPLTTGDWVRHPDQPLYGRVICTEPDGTVAIDYGNGEITLHATQVPRVPDHIATELDRGPLATGVHLDE
ncbi:hypothetical protein [Streptomyces sp. NPDC057909]|uniref:hypothetical protein n=1 Tax=Streptomyces sp. NPDC057909 TaxID=3346277 RepID=UPI0036E61C9C